MPTYNIYSASLAHHGIKGQRWGIRRFQNDDGSLTPEGRERYGVEAVRSTASAMATDIDYDKGKIEDFMHLQFASDKASSLYRLDLYDKNFSYNEVANMPWMFDMLSKYDRSYVPKYMLY